MGIGGVKQVNIDYNAFVTVKQAKDTFGLKDKDIAKINTNNDEYITLKELKSAGYANPGSALAQHFNKEANGALFPALAINQQTQGQVASQNPNTSLAAKNNIHQVTPARQINATNPTTEVKNPVNFGSLFSKSHNTGELSPRVDSDLGYSPVGNVLPHLYA